MLMRGGLLLMGWWARDSWKDDAEEGVKVEELLELACFRRRFWWLVVVAPPPKPVMRPVLACRLWKAWWRSGRADATVLLRALLLGVLLPRESLLWFVFSAQAIRGVDCSETMVIWLISFSIVGGLSTNNGGGSIISLLSLLLLTLSLSWSGVW